jgi:alkylation response protein AidB-like acyl-CoA dehydrogenase
MTTEVTADTRAEILSMIKDFAAREVAPGAMARDDPDAPFAHDLWQAMGRLGLHGLAVPREYGGIGADMHTVCAAARAFARYGRDFGLGFSWLSSMYVTTIPLLQLGTPAQIARYVPRLVSGEIIGSQAITEPHAGSDVKAIRARARPTEGGWELTASKIFITNAPVAGVFLVLAVTDSALGRAGQSLFIVEPDADGFTIGRPMKKMGVHTSKTAEVFLDECAVGSDALLGTPGRGFYDFLISASAERLVLMALTLGTLEACVDQVLEYAQTREQFGGPIANFQAIRIKLANMRIACEAADGLIRRAADLFDEGADVRIATSVAKVFISETCVQQGLEAMQVLGGYGYMREYELERLFRDMKLMTVGGGTNEIHREMIAKGMLSSRHPAAPK